MAGSLGKRAGPSSQKVIVYLASLLSDSTEDAWRPLHDKGGLLPLSTLLRISSRALDWLGSQLSAVGLPGLELTEPQTAAAAAQKAADKLLKQQAAAAEKLEVAVKAAAAFQLAAAANHMFDDVRLSDAAAKSQRLLHSQLAAAWQALESFAMDFVMQCPVASSCGNPHCTHFAQLSDKRLVFGKGRLVRCGACKMVRYCGVECKDKMWPKHKAVCKRLQAKPQTKPKKV